MAINVYVFFYLDLHVLFKVIIKFSVNKEIWNINKQRNMKRFTKKVDVIDSNFCIFRCLQLF